MHLQTDDLRIAELKELSHPAQVMTEFPIDARGEITVTEARAAVHAILKGRDDRLVVVVGPCSIHDPRAAMEYAHRLVAERDRYGGELEIIMRVYFEKPRTTVGWKGLINDPDLDGSFNIDKGLRLARGLLRDINVLGLPAGCEFLDMITPQYTADLVSWGAIGARTTESQVHRELASGLSCPVGFKNGTDGNVRIAYEAMQAASSPHHFLSVTKGGRIAIVATRGNQDCHVILRGGKVPNYDAASVADACAAIARGGQRAQVMIDASHANSSKNACNQPKVINNIAEQIERGDSRIIGIMIESNLLAGRQKLAPNLPLVYGQSITDDCIDWDMTRRALDRLAQAVQLRRARKDSFVA